MARSFLLILYIKHSLSSTWSKITVIFHFNNIVSLLLFFFVIALTHRSRKPEMQYASNTDSWDPPSLLTFRVFLHRMKYYLFLFLLVSKPWLHLQKQKNIWTYAKTVGQPAMIDMKYIHSSTVQLWGTFAVLEYLYFILELKQFSVLHYVLHYIYLRRTHADFTKISL